MPFDKGGEMGLTIDVKVAREAHGNCKNLLDEF
jgi:hypothetical protein